MVMERPILFSTAMVQAILDGRKTMTRRLIKPQPIEDPESGFVFEGKYRELYKNDFLHSDWKSRMAAQFSPYGQPGDVLWVRESFRVSSWFPDDGEISFSFATNDNYKTPCIYFDDDDGEMFNRYWIQSCEDLDKAGVVINEKTECYEDYDKKHLRLRPSIHMPKAAARIWLEVKNIRIEKIKSITREDAAKEGVCYPEGSVLPDWCQRHRFPEENFISLFEKINGVDAVRLNPWVWVIEFKVISTTGENNIKP